MKPVIASAAALHGRPSFIASMLITASLSLMLLPATSAASCPRAVFFDLGDTLVQAGAGGLFVAKPEAQQMLDLLDAGGVQLGVITNVPAGFTRPQLDALLADPSFLDAFDVVLLSSQAPAPKPSPLIYLHAHGLLPQFVAITDTAFVGETLGEIGNSVMTPSSGARATGMMGIHLSSAPPSAIADYTIAPDRLPDIAALVASLCTLHVDGFEAAARWQTRD